MATAKQVRKDLLRLSPTQEAGLLLRVQSSDLPTGAPSWKLLSRRKVPVITQISKHACLRINDFGTSALVAVEGPACDLAELVLELDDVCSGLEFGLNEELIFEKERPKEE